jgi:hypothetical protein
LRGANQSLAFSSAAGGAGSAGSSTVPVVEEGLGADASVSAPLSPELSVSPTG